MRGEGGASGGDNAFKRAAMVYYVLLFVMMLLIIGIRQARERARGSEREDRKNVSRCDRFC